MRFRDDDDPATPRKASETAENAAWQRYNIHDVVRARTNVDGLDFPNYFRVTTAEPNFEIQLVDRIDVSAFDDVRKVGLGTCAFEDGELFFECDVPILYLAGSKRGWKTLIRGLDSEATTILTAFPFFRAGPIQAMTVPMLSRFVRLVLTLKLLARGLAPFYASSVANDGDAFLFFGHSWTGKSTVVSGMIRKGMRFMSDDYSIVDRNGRVYCYPDWHAPHAAREVPILKFLRITAPRFRKARDRISRVAPQADVHSVFFLEQGREEVVEIDRDEAARRISLINLEGLSKLWNSPLSQAVSHYAYFYPRFDLGNLAEFHRSMAWSLVDRAKECLIIRSRSPRFDIVDRFLPRILEVGA